MGSSEVDRVDKAGDEVEQTTAGADGSVVDRRTRTKLAGTAIAATAGRAHNNKNSTELQSASTPGYGGKKFLTEAVSGLPSVSGLERRYGPAVRGGGPVSTRLSAGEFALHAFDVSGETESTLKYDRADSSGIAALGVFGSEMTLVDQVFAELDVSNTPTPIETLTETQSESDDFGEAGSGTGGYGGTQQ